MFATWIQIAELILLPLGLGAGFVAGRASRHDEHVAFPANETITHPGLAPEYPAHPVLFMNTSYPAVGWPSKRPPFYGPQQ
ncbi:hypothetical protein [Amycolatopsis nigrescens]|uniref:hypothetical protein n=1 Tax=Amycolatopsis nigrescens TaxID=381445 RepID=UPI000476E8E8|nr:hypothetical protein [Amycolatopsis nigrescens]